MLVIYLFVQCACRTVFLTLPFPSQAQEISLQYSYEELSAATKLGLLCHTDAHNPFSNLPQHAPRKNWHNSERLGSGSYGSVFKANT